MLREEVGLVLVESVADAFPEVVVESFLCGDVVEQSGLAGVEVPVQAIFKGVDVFDLDVIQEALGSGEKNYDLLFRRERMELGLLEQFGEALSAIELVLRGLVEIAAELREGGEVAVLREVELERGADLLDGLDGRGEADARDGESDVDGWANAGVEEVGLQENLAVGDGNDVGWDVGGDVAGLRFNDGQRGQRS